MFRLFNPFHYQYLVQRPIRYLVQRVKYKKCHLQANSDIFSFVCLCVCIARFLSHSHRYRHFSLIFFCSSVRFFYLLHILLLHTYNTRTRSNHMKSQRKSNELKRSHCIECKSIAFALVIFPHRPKPKWVERRPRDTIKMHDAILRFPAAAGVRCAFTQHTQSIFICEYIVHWTYESAWQSVWAKTLSLDVRFLFCVVRACTAHISHEKFIFIASKGCK